MQGTSGSHKARTNVRRGAKVPGNPRHPVLKVLNDSEHYVALLLLISQLLRSLKADSKERKV